MDIQVFSCLKQRSTLVLSCNETEIVIPENITSLNSVLDNIEPDPPGNVLTVLL